MSDPAVVIDPVASWIQAGGVAAFAAAVWIELRSMRKSWERMSRLMARVLELGRLQTPPRGVRIATQNEAPGSPQDDE